jgi:hypothetical protein
VVAFAELVERAIETIREHEDEWLAELRDERVPLVENKRREAQRLVAEARTDEWLLDRVARWIRGTADDVGFAPVTPERAGEPPDNWQPDPWTLRRHFSELKPWNQRSADDDHALRAFRDGAPAQAARVKAPSAEQHAERAGVLPLDDDAPRRPRRGRPA